MLSLVENGPVVLKKILNFINVFFLFCNHLPFLIIPFTQGYFVPGLVEISPEGLKNKILNFLQWIFAILF